LLTRATWHVIWPVFELYHERDKRRKRAAHGLLISTAAPAPGENAGLSTVISTGARDWR
jgi:hypothetical protein